MSEFASAKDVVAASKAGVDVSTEPSTTASDSKSPSTRIYAIDFMYSLRTSVAATSPLPAKILQVINSARTTTAQSSWARPGKTAPTKAVGQRLGSEESRPVADSLLGLPGQYRPPPSGSQDPGGEDRPWGQRGRNSLLKIAIQKAWDDGEGEPQAAHASAQATAPSTYGLSPEMPPNHYRDRDTRAHPGMVNSNGHIDQKQVDMGPAVADGSGPMDQMRGEGYRDCLPAWANADDLWDSPVDQPDSNVIFSLGDIRRAEHTIEVQGMPADNYFDLQTRKAMQRASPPGMETYNNQASRGQDIFFGSSGRRAVPEGESKFISLFASQPPQAQHQQQRMKAPLSDQQQAVAAAVLQALPYSQQQQIAASWAAARQGQGDAPNKAAVREHLLNLLGVGKGNSPSVTSSRLNPAAPKFAPSGLYNIETPPSRPAPCSGADYPQPQMDYNNGGMSSRTQDGAQGHQRPLSSQEYAPSASELSELLQRLVAKQRNGNQISGQGAAAHGQPNTVGSAYPPGSVDPSSALQMLQRQLIAQGNLSADQVSQVVQHLAKNKNAAQQLIVSARQKEARLNAQRSMAGQQARLRAQNGHAMPPPYGMNGTPINGNMGMDNNRAPANLAQSNHIQQRGSLSPTAGGSTGGMNGTIPNNITLPVQGRHAPGPGQHPHPSAASGFMKMGQSEQGNPAVMEAMARNAARYGGNTNSGLQAHHAGSQPPAGNGSQFIAGNNSHRNAFNGMPEPEQNPRTSPQQQALLVNALEHLSQKLKNSGIATGQPFTQKVQTTPYQVAEFPHSKEANPSNRLHAAQPNSVNEGPEQTSSKRTPAVLTDAARAQLAALLKDQMSQGGGAQAAAMALSLLLQKTPSNHSIHQQVQQLLHRRAENLATQHEDHQATNAGMNIRQAYAGHETGNEHSVNPNYDTEQSRNRASETEAVPAEAFARGPQKEISAERISTEDSTSTDPQRERKANVQDVSGPSRLVHNPSNECEFGKDQVNDDKWPADRTRTATSVQPTVNETLPGTTHTGMDAQPQQDLKERRRNANDFEDGVQGNERTNEAPSGEYEDTWSTTVHSKTKVDCPPVKETKASLRTSEKKRDSSADSLESGQLSETCDD